MTTDTWTGTSGYVGYWSTASSWSTGIPAPTSDVVIADGGQVYVEYAVPQNPLRAGPINAVVNSLSVAVGNELLIPDTSSLKVSGPAGFGSAGVLTGVIFLRYGGYLYFGSGQITTIAARSQLILYSKGYLADTADPNSNSALTGLQKVDGTIYLYDGAALNVDGPLSVDKGGKIELESTPVYVNGVETSLGSSNLTVQGVLTNHGQLDEVVDGDARIAASGGLINDGVINLKNIGRNSTSIRLQVAGTVTNNGTIRDINATSIFYWSVGGAGNFDIEASSSDPAELGFFGGVGSHQNIYFTSSNATLLLGDADHFYGRIGDFESGDTIVAKDFGAGTTANFVEAANNENGVLTLTNGAHEAQLIFNGDYANSDFAVTSVAAGTTIKFV